MSVQTHPISFKQRTVLATLLSCSALYLPLNAEAATAKTSWAVSRVASASLGSYCTMAQKYSDDTVLTLAQNTQGEYSLAVDFKDKKFTQGKKQTISINAGGNTTKSFEVVPQSEKTVVLGIGKDDAFIKQIQNAQKLTVKVGSEVSDFGLSEFESGQKDLGSCVEGIQTSADKPADGTKQAAAEKTVVKSAAPVIRKNEIALKQVDVQSEKEPSVEGLLAAMPKPSSDIAPVQDDTVAMSPVKSNSDARSTRDERSTNLQSEVASLRDENARLSRALSEQRKSFEDRQLNTDGAALNEMREKLDAATADNKSLNDQVAKLSADKSAVVPQTTPENSKLVQIVKNLQQENQTLKNQNEMFANAKDSKAANSDVLARVQAENADLKQVIADLKAAPKVAPVVADNSANDEVNKLRADNRKLNNELDMAKTEKSTLQAQTSNLQKDLENKQLKMSGGSWDLEQATRRYQESQREIVRLGSILQSQDVKCTNEKKDIEYMLFDPAIASKAQIAMLNSMEDQIKEKDAQLQLAQSGIGSVQVQSSSAKDANEKDAKIAELQKSISETNIALAEKTQLLSDAQAALQQAQAVQSNGVSKDKDVAALKADLAQKSQQLAEAQSKIQQGNKSQLTTTSKKDEELASVKALLIKTQAQLATEQANAQKTNVKEQAQQSAEQATSIASLQMQVQQANKTITQLQKQVSESNQAALKSAPVTPSVAAVKPAPTDTAAHFKTIEEFSKLLKNAGVSVSGSLEQVKGSDPANYRAYSWKTDSLYGSAEMKKVSDASQFDSTVDQYLSRAKSRCNGEFAAVPSPVRASGMEQSKAYEIACVGQSASSSASVLFTYGHQMTTIIAHEGRADAMDMAIDARDKISSKIN